MVRATPRHPTGCTAHLRLGALWPHGLGAMAGGAEAAARWDEWLVADLLIWEPGRRYRVWHDRAVFHFLTTPGDRRQYLHALGSATEPGAAAVIGCFAPDGPPRCPGLPVARYRPPELADQLGSEWKLIGQACEEHLTPAGVVQPFTWAALRKQPSPATSPRR